MECSSCSGGQGALGIQASAAATLLAGANQTPPPAQTGNDPARAAGLQAQGIGQKLDVVA